MASYLLRAEAVNFEWTCDDTQDLSTMRGGSMLLVNAHELIGQFYGAWPVVHGASQAIWRIDVSCDEHAELARCTLAHALASLALTKHATFVVDVVAAGDEGVDKVKELRTRNRWRQYQQPTLHPPAFAASDFKSKQPCTVDLVRPATTTVFKGVEEAAVSGSVADRRAYGRNQKQTFYNSVVPGIALEFANELDDITSRIGCGADDALWKLHHKMAVIYLDGNKQGEMAAELGVAQLAEFRKQTRGYQQAFLRGLLGEILASQAAPGDSDDWHVWERHSKHPAEGKHLARLETVIWGGDDILLVVPAWQAWPVVQLFFKHVTGATGDNEPWMFGTTPFTYAAGVVMCNYKASIHRIRTLADQLMIQGKKRLVANPHANHIGYEVLESFDIANAELERWRSARLSSDIAQEELLLLEPAHMEPIAQLVRHVRADVQDPDCKTSRRQLERLARLMPRRSAVHPVDGPAFDREIETTLGNRAVDMPELTMRQKLHHVVTLWDYIK